MAGLKNIKLKITSVKKTSTVTRAMEAVSAVKMRKAQERALSARSYAAAGLSILVRIATSRDAKKHPLMHSQSGKTAMVVITSDKGLAGSLNSAVLRLADQEIALRNLHKESLLVFAIGRRGAEYFANRGFVVHSASENLSDDAREDDVRKMVDTLIALHGSGEIGRVFVVYTNFLSTFEQKAIVRSIIPIETETIAKMVTGIAPVRGKYSAVTEESLVAPHAYSIEPDAETVLTALIPKLVSIALYHALLENKASEHSARMVAMKSATDKAKDMARELTRLFNKVRQAAITREVSEITSGMEAMR